MIHAVETPKAAVRGDGPTIDEPSPARDVPRTFVATPKRIAYALAYAKLGWAVLPVRAGSKVPLTARGFKDATTDATTIRDWWASWPNAGIGIALAPSGLAAIDIDPRNGGSPEALPETLETLTARTGGGGWHLLVRVPADATLPGKLATGVDVKYRGYVVVEPSRHPSGRTYSWVEWDPLEGSIPPIAQAPGWMLRAAPDAPAAAPNPTSSALDAVLDLRTAVREIMRGQSYHDNLVRLAARFVVKGMPSADVVLVLRELMASSDDRSERWHERYNAIPGAVRSAVEKFSPAIAATGGRFEFLSVEQLLARPAPAWRIVGALPARGLGVVWGASGSGKTFAVLDAMLAIVQGRRWAGLRVKQGAVVYIAAEGNLAQRMRAYLEHHALDVAALSGLQVLDRAVNLLNPAEDLPDLLADLRALEAANGPIGAVVVDTLNRVMPGGDENGPEDMGAVVASAKRIEELLGCLVLFVHHSGKDETKGGRGHSSLKAAADVEWSVKRVGDVRTVTIEKLRDGEDGRVLLTFRLQSVDLGPARNIDSDAAAEERISSCVVVSGGAASTTAVPAGKVQRAAVAILRQCGAMSRSELRRRLIEAGVSRTGVYKAVDKLVEMGIVADGIDKLHLCDAF